METLRHTRNANPLTRVRVAKHPSGPSLAKQSFANECNINKILKKFEKNGTIDHTNPISPTFGNYIHFGDYHTSLNKILEAQDAFAAIPSAIRNRFGNDPARFLEFAQDETNLDEMITMGLAPARIREAAPADPDPSPLPPPDLSKSPSTTPPAPANPPQGA